MGAYLSAQPDAARAHAMWRRSIVRGARQVSAFTLWPSPTVDSLPNARVRMRSRQSRGSAAMVAYRQRDEQRGDVYVDANGYRRGDESLPEGAALIPDFSLHLSERSMRMNLRIELNQHHRIRDMAASQSFLAASAFHYPWRLL